MKRRDVLQRSSTKYLKETMFRQLSRLLLPGCAKGRRIHTSGRASVHSYERIVYERDCRHAGLRFVDSAGTGAARDSNTRPSSHLRRKRINPRLIAETARRRNVHSRRRPGVAGKPSTERRL